MSRASIRRAQEADFDDVTALYEEFHVFHVLGVPSRLRLPPSFSDPAPREGERAQLRALLVAILQNTSAALLLAEAEGKIVGLAEVYLRSDEVHSLTVQHTYGYLQSLTVAERWRRHGVGAQLLAQVEKWARERGATQLRLDTWEFAAGPLPFYEGLGYQTIKRTLVKPLTQGARPVQS
jgi:GNAT superfamily N-acetyltransferase